MLPNILFKRLTCITKRRVTRHENVEIRCVWNVTLANISRITRYSSGTLACVRAKLRWRAAALATCIARCSCAHTTHTHTYAHTHNKCNRSARTALAPHVSTKLVRMRVRVLPNNSHQPPHRNDASSSSSYTKKMRALSMHPSHSIALVLAHSIHSKFAGGTLVRGQMMHAVGCWADAGDSVLKCET